MSVMHCAYRCLSYRRPSCKRLSFLLPLNFTVFLKVSYYQLVTCCYMVSVSIYGVHGGKEVKGNYKYGDSLGWILPSVSCKVGGDLRNSLIINDIGGGY